MYDNIIKDKFILIDLFYIVKENLILDVLCWSHHKMEFKNAIGFKRAI